MVSENEKLILSIFHPFSSQLSDIPMTILRFMRERLDPDRIAAQQRPAGRNCDPRPVSRPPTSSGSACLETIFASRPEVDIGRRS